jgi:hypothetical protein
VLLKVTDHRQKIAEVKQVIVFCETPPFADMTEDSSWIMLNMWGGRSSEMLVLMYKCERFHMPENWTLY